MLNVGFADFSQPTIIFLGNGSDLLWLSNRIRERSKFLFSEFRNNTILHGIDVEFLHVEADSKSKFEKMKLTICFSPMQSWEYYDKILTAVNLKRPCHIYLDVDVYPDDLQIVISLDEYKPEFIFSGLSDTRRMSIS